MKEDSRRKSPMMTFLKTWCILPLTVLVLLHLTSTETKVVGSISECQEFLLQYTAPNVAGIIENSIIKDQKRYKIICQTYEGIKRFMTLYDTENKIPVFSAFKFKGTGSSTKRPIWMMEPQLEESSQDDNMRNANKLSYIHQASDDDYKDPRYKDNYNRGHLRPFSYGFDESDQKSTCTLTNIVPQAIKFNGGSWENMETCVKCILQEYCVNNNGAIEGYIVTGAISGDIKLNNRVNIPKELWSAFCCYNKVKGMWLASAYWGSNTDENPEHLKTETLNRLQQQLDIEAFPNTNCPLKKTVAKFYPLMDEECKCPQFRFNSARVQFICEKLKYCNYLKSVSKVCKKISDECSQLSQQLFERRDIVIPSTYHLLEILRKFEVWTG